MGLNDQGCLDMKQLKITIYEGTNTPMQPSEMLP